MGLSSELISQFAKLTKPKTDTKKESVTYGTIVESDGTQYVKIDGSEILTPMTTTTKVSNGQRVTVMIKDHSAVVTGNITSPAVREEEVEESGKTATDYIGYDPDEGLTIGRKLGDAWEGFRTRITSSAYEILNAAGDILASYGANIVELGKYSKDAIIKMCAGSAELYVDDSERFRIDSRIVRIVGTDEEYSGSSIGSNVSNLGHNINAYMSTTTVAASAGNEFDGRVFMGINYDFASDPDSLGSNDYNGIAYEGTAHLQVEYQNDEDGGDPKTYISGMAGEIDFRATTINLQGDTVLVNGSPIGSGGGSGDTAFDLLWENPDPDSPFAAQTVPMPDMRPYAFITYVYKYKDTYSHLLSQTVPRGENAMLSFSAKNGTGRRFVTYDDYGTISFEGGSNAGSDNDDYVIPYKIYGVSITIMGRQLTTEDIVDDLTSTEPLKLLSANQGRVLNEKINNLELSGGGGSWDTYSTEPVAIGTWIDGKTIYRKVFETGALPNDGQLQIDVGVDNLDFVIALRGMVSNGNYISPIPYAVEDTSNVLNITYRPTLKKININTYSDRSAYSGYVIIEYTTTE